MPLLARCCGKAVRLCTPPHNALGIQGITSPHDLISVWAFMWNIASPHFTPFFQVVTIPPLDSLTQLRNATIRNVSVGGGESEAVRTQLGQTHCTPLCLRKEVSVTVREFHWWGGRDSKALSVGSHLGEADQNCLKSLTVP